MKEDTQIMLAVAALSYGIAPIMVKYGVMDIRWGVIYILLSVFWLMIIYEPWDQRNNQELTEWEA